MKIIVRWSASYETELEMPDNATETDIKDEAAKIDISVPGSTYQQDTWDVEKVISNGKDLD